MDIVASAASVSVDLCARERGVTVHAAGPSEARTLIGELGECFTTKGMQPNPETSWSVRGTDTDAAVGQARTVIAANDDVVRHGS